MDNTEDFSDSSEYSKNSEPLSSNLSTFSGLNEYESEFLNLKELVQAECGPKNSTINPFEEKTAPSAYHKQIENLTLQLNSATKLRARYKQDLFNLEKKKDVSCNEKIEKLLKQNKQLEFDLFAANNQIQRLITFNSITVKSTETEVFQDKILELEKSNNELINQNYHLSNKVNQCSLQKNEIQNEYDNVKSEINDLKLELSTKINCINELKKKILDQHVQLQSMSQSNVKLSHSLDLMSSELEYVRKSENWYKGELHQLQKEKNNLYDVTLQNEKNLALQGEKVERLTLKMNSWRCMYDELQLTVLKERQKIFEQAEIVSKNIVNENSSVKHDDTVDIDGITSHYEKVINDLTNDIAKIKADFENQHKSFEDVTKEKSDILTKYTSLEKCVNEKENVIKQLENNIRDVTLKLETAVKNQMEQSTKLLEANKTCANLKIGLSVKNQDKLTIEKSVQQLKEQFVLFRDKYNFLKDSLHKKNQELSKLMYEKQILYTTSNQKTFKLEKEVKKQAEEVEALKEKLIFLEHNPKVGGCDKCEHLKKEILQLQLIHEQFQSKYLNLLYKYRTTNVDFNSEELDSCSVIQETEQMDRSLEENSSFNVADLLKHINKLCNVDEAEFINCFQYCDFNITDIQKNYIKILLNKILLRLQETEDEIISKNNGVVQLKKTLNGLVENSVSRIKYLEDKCKVLWGKTEANVKRLQELSINNSRFSDCNVDDEIQHLRVLLEVKSQEEKEKQKRYEKNYRTLLKKVKEHMRGRNTAEKYNIHLQQLNCSLSDECNKLRLQLDLKQNEHIDLQNLTQKYSKENEKLKQTALKFEKNCYGLECSKCKDFNALKDREKELMELLRDYESCKVNNSELMKERELLERLQRENEQIPLKLCSISVENEGNITKLKTYVEHNEELNAKLKDVENILSEERRRSEHLNNELINAESTASKFSNENNLLNKKLESITDKNMYLQEQVEDLNSGIRQKLNEINDLNLRRKHSECRRSEMESNMGNLITSLKRQVFDFKNEIDVIKSEKFFLRRLCNDLKVALIIHINNNKALKEYINKACKEEECYNKDFIDLSKFSLPNVHRDGYIDGLLQEARSCLQEKPVSDIEDCFDVLKSGILFIQRQIVKKNVI